MTSRTVNRLALGIACGSLVFSGCGVDGGGETPKSETTAAAAASSGPVTGPDSVPKVKEDEELRIAFFGFARANAFASATYSGIESYAKDHHATAEFLDSNFDAQTQVSQIQDAVTSQRFDVFVVQANDGSAVVPALEQAVAAGIKVVAEFTPVGSRYDTAESQVNGVINLLDVPTDNGKALGELGAQACKELGVNPCEAAYLQGFKALPLDNARTEAAKQALEAAGVKLVASVEGGYTNDTGRAAMQDVLQSHPGVDVVIGSSQAVAGAEQAAGKDSKIAFVANGGSRQAMAAVREGRWFAAYCLPEATAGATAAALGLAAARGAAVPAANSSTALAPSGGKCRAAEAKEFKGEYDD
jgi:ribose transport system substrate-binding protein